MIPQYVIGLIPAVFLVAALYASVGHGGASGYLAALAFFGFAPAAMKSSALLLNLIVAAIAFSRYRRAGYFDGRLFWPFAAASIPAAFLGGRWNVPPSVYSWLLALCLVAAAFRLAWPDDGSVKKAVAPSALVAAALGAGIGLLSGIVGVGGGIFLSPVLILAGWADAKTAASVSAAFIWVNSAAGLLGASSIRPDIALWPLAAVAAAGGWLGSGIGARRLSSPALRRVLAAVLLLAAVKIARTPLV